MAVAPRRMRRRVRHWSSRLRYTTSTTTSCTILTRPARRWLNRVGLRLVGIVGKYFSLPGPIRQARDIPHSVFLATTMKLAFGASAFIGPSGPLLTKARPTCTRAHRPTTEAARLPTATNQEFSEHDCTTAGAARAAGRSQSASPSAACSGVQKYKV